MKIKIIIPVYSSESDFPHPETRLTPKRQIEWVRQFANDIQILDKDVISVATNSSYIAEALHKIRQPINKGDNFGDLIEVIYSDGKEDIDSNIFWKHFADPMRDLMFHDIQQVDLKTTQP